MALGSGYDQQCHCMVKYYWSMCHWVSGQPKGLARDRNENSNKCGVDMYRKIKPMDDAYLNTEQTHNNKSVDVTKPGVHEIFREHSSRMYIHSSSSPGTFKIFNVNGSAPHVLERPK
jgi:hypothetical protein